MTMGAERSTLPATRPSVAADADAVPGPDASVEQTLGHCERLLDAVDSGRRRVALVQAVSLAVMASVVLAIVLGTVEARGSLGAWLVAAVACAVFVATAAALSARLIAALRGQVRRDELIMVDLIGRQRELVPLLARREEWSSAQLYLTQKRLERFPVDAEPLPDQYRRLRR